MSLYIQPPLIAPESLWTPPAEFPTIGKVFGFDSETKDPLLEEKGPGSIRKTGYPIGISIAEKRDNTYKGWYMPWRHEGGGNLDKGMILRWAKPILTDPTKLLIGANILYELEWMAFEGIDIQCQLFDVQIAEALLDEEAFSMSLDSVMFKHLGRKKNDKGLVDAAKAWGFHPKNDLWRLHAKYVGPYAESDAIDPIQIWEKQVPLLEKDNLTEVCKMEHELLPIIWKMRQRGVRVDIEKAHLVYKEWQRKEAALYADLRKMVSGVSLDSVWSNEQVEAGAIALSLPYPRTRNGQPSFVDAWLSDQEHPFWKHVSEIRGVNKLNDTFVKQSIIDNAVNGRVHCQFHPTRRDEGGTRSGRLSCSHPNLQQSPNPEHSADAWKVRSIFVPEIGEQWGKLDYSQQEPRLVVHYGCVKGFSGAAEAQREYASNPEADFYQILVKLASITRSESKRLYLGRSYGMGKDKLARSLGVSVDEAVAVASKMDEAVPFIKLLYDDVMKSAQSRGFIQTIGGRRAHFDSWEPSRWPTEDDYKADQENGGRTVRRNERGGYNWVSCPVWQAKKQWEKEWIKRANTHKALNRLIQGGAADMTKIAMIKLYRAGIMPLLQVHDELDFSYADPKVMDQAKEIMEHAIELKLPIYADLKTGASWGEAK